MAPRLLLADLVGNHLLVKPEGIGRELHGLLEPETHRWARCALFAAGVAGLGGSYALALREGIEAAEAAGGANETAMLGKALSAIGKGTSSGLGTSSSLAIVAHVVTGGCVS